MKTLTATSSRGLAIYINVPPGTYDLAATGPAGTNCSIMAFNFGWDGMQANSSAIQMIADSITTVTFGCQ